MPDQAVLSPQGALPARAPSPWSDELRATVALSLPLVAANLLQMAVYAVDVIFVARLGEQALAVSSLAIAVFASMLWGFQGLVSGSAPLIGAELGRKPHAVREVRRSVRMALWLSGLCGLVGIGICWIAESMMLATGQDPVISAMAGDFIMILAVSIIPTVIASILRIFVAALGRPILATLVTALAIAVNAFGNWVMVFGNLGMPKLGLYGSAWSTLLTSVIMVAAYILLIQSDRRLRRYRIFGRWWRPEWSRMKAIAKIGVPIALTLIAEGGLFNSAAFLMGRIGTTELAAHTIGLQIAAIFFQVPFGIAQAATIRVAFYFGAHDKDGIVRAGWTAILLCIVFQMVGASVMLFAPLWPIAIYVDPAATKNAAIVAVAVQLLIVGAAFQLFDGLQTVAAGVLRGLQDTRTPMIIAICGYWLGGFTAAYWLGLKTPIAATGVWIGLMIGVVIVSALLLWRWKVREKLGLINIDKTSSQAN